MTIKLAVVCVFAGALFGADTGFNQDGTGKLLPKGAWRVTAKLFDGRYAVVVPGNPNAYFEQRIQTLVFKGCFGLLANLEACGEAAGRRDGQSVGFGYSASEFKYRAFYKPYEGGEALLAISAKAWSPFTESYPLALYGNGGQQGSAMVRYGAAYEPKLTAFISQGKVAAQAFVSYRVNTGWGSFTPGNSACGGASVYFSPQDIRRPVTLSVASDVWSCNQSGSMLSGQVFENGRRVAGVGPALILSLGPNVTIKAGFGILTSKPAGIINLNADFNDGYSFAISMRK